jgi:hypothetical protein
MFWINSQLDASSLLTLRAAMGVTAPTTKPLSSNARDLPQPPARPHPTTPRPMQFHHSRHHPARPVPALPNARR